jgi:hypothetical protein
MPELTQPTPTPLAGRLRRVLSETTETAALNGEPPDAALTVAPIARLGVVQFRSHSPQ